MYYEEQWIGGALCWRTSLDGAWTRYTANELAHRYESAEKRAADAQATAEALQTKYDDLLGKYRQLVDFYDKHNGTPCEQIRHRQQVEALQWEVANLKACQCDGCAETLEENDVYCEKCWTRQQTALDAERAEIAKVRATCDMLGKERNEADEAKYHAELKLSQLQALVREVANAGVAFEDGRIPYKEVQIDRDWFDRARATLDATTPAHEQVKHEK